MEKYIDQLLNLALKASKNHDIPVGAIIIKNDKILSKAYNKRFKSHVVTEHAEISAIIKAEKKIKDFRLNGCIMITTLKPCKMCYEVIEASRIDKIYYILDQNVKYSYPQDKYIMLPVENNEKIEKYKEIFLSFFKKMR